MKISIKKIIITLGILTTLGGIHFGVIPYILSSSLVTNKIQNIILNKYNLNLTLNNYKVRTCITPHIKIKAKEIKLNNSQTQDIIEIQNIDTKINLLNFIFQTLSISKLDVDNINISLKTDYSEKLFTPNFIKLIKHTTLKNTNIHNLSINLENQNLIEDINIASSDIIINRFCNIIIGVQ